MSHTQPASAADLPQVEHLSCAIRDGVAEIRVSRPERRNAFTNAMYRGLSDMLVALDRIDDVRCIIVRGSNGIFTSGSDIRHFLDMGAAERDSHFLLVADMLTAPSRISKPVIAAVQGFALGSATGLTAACDLAIAEEGSTFGLPEVAVGLWPCTLLPALIRAVGARKAYELAVLGERIDAQQALAAGLVNRVVSAADFETELARMAGRIAGSSPVVIQMGKRAFQQALDTEFHTATRFMGQVMALNSATEDAHRGISAFLNRTKPEWTGK
ncbi:MAG: enoyl-CoA hydratase [Herminiimonas sp.]|jgi:enoyl-CoA hydratase/carnithine racemase|nr:enoyl-CoA hydratase [Herminiimonas sp.]